MALMQIRGEQIKDHQIIDTHVKGKFSEAVLDINYAAHASEILDMKLINDYVQKVGITVVAGGSITVVLPSPVAVNAASKGTVQNALVKIRDSATGEPINDGTAEIYGKLSNYLENSGQNTYTLSFFKKDATNVEIAATLIDGRIDILFPQRFSLADIPANFLENERFVDGAADVTAHLNIQQIGKDVFGAGYTYANMGVFTNPFGNGNSFSQQLTKLTSGDVNTNEKASAIIDEVVASRGNKTSLDERLDVALNDNGTLKLGNKIHAHVLKDALMLADSNAVEFNFGGVDSLDTPKSGDIFVVYVNGLRQIGGTSPRAQYTATIVGNKVTIGFVANVYADDLVELEAIIHGNE